MRTIHIDVVNRREGQVDRPGTTVYVGRPTPLGNPFAIGIDGTREEVVEEYAEWLNVQLQDPEPNEQQAMFSKLIQKARLHGRLHLQCWCAPKKCHAEVIRDALYDVLGKEGARQ